MPDYSKCKVYKIVDNTTGKIYVGSTIQTLRVRKAGHVRSFKYWKKGKGHYVSSFDIIKNGDYDIVLIEEVDCQNKEQLHRVERKWIDELDCVNRCIPTRTHAERQKDYRQAHPDKRKQYYEAHKDQILAKRRQERCVCPCGSEYPSRNKAKHVQSKKHQAFISANNLAEAPHPAKSC